MGSERSLVQLTMLIKSTLMGAFFSDGSIEVC